MGYSKSIKAIIIILILSGFGTLIYFLLTGVTPLTQELTQTIMLVIGAVIILGILYSITRKKGALSILKKDRIFKKPTLTPVEAAPLIKSYFERYWGKRISVRPLRTGLPELQIGEDKFCRYRITDRDTYETEIIKVPLQRGKKAVLEGDYDYDDDGIDVAKTIEKRQYHPKTLHEPSVFQALEGQEGQEEYLRAMALGQILKPKPVKTEVEVKYPDEPKPVKEDKKDG